MTNQKKNLDWLRNKYINKRIIILGLGAIGGIIVAKLSQKYEVLAVGRKNIVEAIDTNGLRISGLINQKIRFHVTTSLTLQNKDVVVILTTKTHNVATAIKSIKGKISKNSIIVCVQNGLSCEDIVRGLVDQRVVRGITFLSAEMISPGEVNLVSDNMTYFGKKDKDIIEIFENTGFKTQIVDNLKEIIWRKLVFNCVINGLGTIFGVPNNYLDNPLLNRIKKLIVKECLLVAKAEHIELNNNILDQINTFIKSSINVNSTLQDLKRGKRTEIEYLNGEIVRIGKSHHIATPINSMICDLIHHLEASY